LTSNEAASDLYALFRYAQQKVARKSDILLTGSILMLAVFGLGNREYHRKTVAYQFGTLW
jgi:hypothetical protein